MAYNESPHDQAGPGAIAVGVLESSPETKVALRINDDGRLMVEVAGLAIDADIIDLDMNAITGAPPNSRTLYDIYEVLQSIGGGWSLTDVLSLINNTANAISGGWSLDDVLSAINGAAGMISGGSDLMSLQGEVASVASGITAGVTLSDLGAGSTLGDLVAAINGLKGVDNRTLTDVYNACSGA